MIRCIQIHGAEHPSPWEREVYANRDRIEHLIRKLHEPIGGQTTLGFTVWQLMGINYADLIDRAHRDLKDRVARLYWTDPVL